MGGSSPQRPRVSKAGRAHPRHTRAESGQGVSRELAHEQNGAETQASPSVDNDRQWTHCLSHPHPSDTQRPAQLPRGIYRDRQDVPSTVARESMPAPQHQEPTERTLSLRPGPLPLGTEAKRTAHRRWHTPFLKNPGGIQLPPAHHGPWGERSRQHPFPQG